MNAPDANLHEALVRLEEATYETAADIKILVREILTKKVRVENRFSAYTHNHIDLYGVPPEYQFLTLPEYFNNDNFRARVHKLLKKLYTAKRVIAEKEKYALWKQRHQDSGFDRVCEEILYMPGLGAGFRRAETDFATCLEIIETKINK